jgi:hypothetical protein
MGSNRNGNDVAGFFYPNNNQVRATIHFEDHYAAVRRCIINDLVAGAQDEDENLDRGHRNCGCR